MYTWRTSGLGAALIPLVSAQIFCGQAHPDDFLPLSDACVGAIDTTVRGCSDLLHPQVKRHMGGYMRDNFEADELEQICQEGCQSELVALKAHIELACYNDVLAKDNIAYPATFLTDHYIYAIDQICRRDSSTNIFCDILVMEAEEAGDDDIECLECILSSWKAQLQSPFGYDEDYADDFAAQISRCTATGYDFTPPTPYALNTTAIPEALPTPPPLAPGTAKDCTEYTRGLRGNSEDVVEINSCEWMAHHYKVTIEELLEWNPSLSREFCFFSNGNKYCVGKEPRKPNEAVEWSYCLPITEDDIVPGTDTSCNCYNSQHGGDVSEYVICEDMVEELEIGVEDLVAMNPWLGSVEDCETNLFRGVGEHDKRYFCIGVADGLISPVRPPREPVLPWK